jgi:hypothetical protein
VSLIRQQRARESDAQFVERIARTRGRLERKFWERAIRLKALLAPGEGLARTVKEEVQLALARAAARSANRSYLHENLERALLRQRQALRLLRQFEKKKA